MIVRFPGRSGLACALLAVLFVSGCAEGGSALKDAGGATPETFDAGTGARACETDDDCVDGIACTSEICNLETSACEYTEDDSQCELTEQCVLERGCELRPPCEADDDCDDGDFCNGVEHCDTDLGTGCQRGIAPTCDDGLGCTMDACNAELNVCEHAPNHARCSSGAACDGEERCEPETARADANGCVAGTPLACDDGIDCTVDDCTEPAGCVFIPDSNACDNSTFCDGVEVCDATRGCQPGTAATCDDGFDCTTDACVVLTDRCAHTTNDAMCRDTLVCNGSETCQVGMGCVAGTPVVCDDGAVCTTDRCAEPGGTCEVLGSDADSDGFTAVGCGAGNDCNDLNPNVHPGVAEICDGIDNDCSGGADNAPSMQCVRGSAPVDCTTTCGTPGRRACSSSCTLGPCVATTEACNACDDTGNGAIDEGLACVMGSFADCNTSCGTAGRQPCRADCSGHSTCVAGTETCNGCDDDGDGLPDDGLTCVRGTSRECPTSCGPIGTQACRLNCSGWDTCIATEICNGCDDDGDGTADDGVGACRQNHVANCTTACSSPGTQRCATDCSGYSTCLASAEVCGNGCDDNGSGGADDGCGGANANCSGALVLAQSGGTRSDTFATPSRTVTDCGSGGQIWYRITLGSRRILYVDTFGSTFDTTVSLRTSCSGVAVQCEDDDCSTNQEQLVRVLNAGTYYIAVHSFASGPVTGTVQLRWQTIAAGNGAYARITANGNYTGTTSGTGTLNASCAGGDGPENGVYYTVCPSTSRTVTANTCTGTAFDSVVSIHGSNDAELACNDDTTGCGTDNRSSSTSAVTVGPGLFVIDVDGYASASSGAFQLAVGGL